MSRSAPRRPAVRLAIGPVRVSGLSDAAGFEAALRQALAEALADPGLAGAGTLRLGAIRIGVPCGASAAEASRQVAAQVRAACLAGLGREAEGRR